MKRLLSEEQDKYNKERDSLKKEEGAVEGKLKETKTKLQHYSEIGIETIIAKIAQEQELRVRKTSLLNQQSVLTDKNTGITTRYMALMQELDNNLKEFVIQARQRINEIERIQTDEVARIQSKYVLERDNCHSGWATHQ